MGLLHQKMNQRYICAFKCIRKSSIRILIEGQKVSYNIAKNKGRTSAVNIKMVE